jgi:hypothetical protein
MSIWIRPQKILIVLSTILLVWPACLLRPKPSLNLPEEGKSLIIGSCAFQWGRGGGERKEKLDVRIEELISGTIYEGHTDKDGFYFFPDVRPGIYTLKLIHFNYQDISVEHRPLIKLFIINPGKVFYLGRFVVEADTADLRRGERYPCYEKYLAADLNEGALRKIIASHKDGQGWSDHEIILENELEKF